MTVARRPLLTATAAATLLAALWFVPSANATDDPAGAPGARSGPATAAGDTAAGPRLADTGTGTDTTPYLIGGVAFLGIGAALVSRSARRTDALSV
ncbi:LPXTG cell wall anchor domain-containing protein [Streptomyces atratus]|uniref:LPXTG-motif cell wall anchor domain-containing protein n=1 Tax=Streptomyces atratus TaxID=1893 RepID=A0A1K2CIM1_STRAR|nr:LPXTG cell wall anchor domain-containing protein [Streptomyces atratus]SFY10855.1 LPXTG-motif cell wall anchor domain-containing protein [Streptomyces atratus]